MRAKLKLKTANERRLEGNDITSSSEEHSFNKSTSRGKFFFKLSIAYVCSTLSGSLFKAEDRGLLYQDGSIKVCQHCLPGFNV